MKRKILTLAVAALTVGSAMAVPARRIARMVTQPDGSTVTVTLTGDEWFHSYVTSDGLAVVLTPEGYAVYLSADGPTDVYVHELAERTAAEQSFIASASTSMTYSALRAASPRMVLMEANAAKRPRMKIAQAANGKAGIVIEQEVSQVPHKGIAHIPIILVEYPDVKFKDGANVHQVFEEFFNTGEKSCYKYFQDMSQGQYDPKFHIIGPVTMSNNREYYGGHDYWGNDERPGHMVREALAAVDPSEDMSIYDNDGDGEADVVVVLYAGVGQASSNVDEAVWPCQWNLTESTGSSLGPIFCDGVKYDRFAVFNELNGTYQNQLDGPGTFCHEFSHCLGLPDFYDTKYNGHFGMGNWSLMDHGSYNDDGYTPIGYSAYEKAFMGWITLEEGERNTFYELPVLNDPDDPQSKAIVLVNERDANEYFIFENRAKVGWDAYIAGNGMMINHVTYSASSWANNVVNNYTLQRMTIVPADNYLNESSYAGDLWPRGNQTEFTDTSTPAAKVSSGGYLSIPVTEIKRDATTGVVSLWVDRTPVSPVTPPVLAEPVAGDEPGSFVASWNAVEIEGTDVSYTLQYWPQSEDGLVPLLVQDFDRDNNNWTLDGGYMQYSTYLALGFNGLNGSATSTATLSPEDGALTVVVRAKRYASDTDAPLVITLLDSNGKMAAVKEFVTGKDQAYFSAAFSGLDSSESYRVCLSSRGTPNKRIMLYYAMVFGGDCADMADADYDKAYKDDDSSVDPLQAPVVTADGGRTTVTGITETSYSVTGLEKDGSYCYRVKAVPVDDSVAKESFWSAVQNVNLSGLSGVTDIESEATVSGWRVVDGEILATPGARLYSVSGIEVKALSPGHFAPAPGAYILVTPGHRPAKIVL